MGHKQIAAPSAIVWVLSTKKGRIVAKIEIDTGDLALAIVSALQSVSKKEQEPEPACPDALKREDKVRQLLHAHLCNMWHLSAKEKESVADYGASKGYTQSVRMRAVGLVTEGKTFDQVAKIIGCSETTVIHWAADLLVAKLLKQAA